MGIHDFALFVAAGLMLNLTPGPDMAYIVARGANGGFTRGLRRDDGDHCGMRRAHARGGGGIVGAARHVRGGIQRGEVVRRRLSAVCGGPSHRRRASRPAPRGGRRILLAAAPATRIFREAFVINVFNPKVALFFLAFLPQFIDASAPSKTLAFIALGCVFNFNSLFVNVPVAWLAARAGRGARTTRRGETMALGAVGALFVALAVRLALAERT